MGDEYIAISEISLNREEMQLLNAIRSGGVYLNEESLVAAKRLNHFKLAEIVFAPAGGAVRFGDPSSKGCLITDRGKDFIAYKKQRSRDRKLAFISEVFFTLLSAIFGALLSEPLWDFLREIFAVL